MTLIDPIGDMVSRIKNAIRTRRESVEMPSSKTKVEIAKILKEEGYVGNFEVLTKGPKSSLVINLKYRKNKNNVITGIKRVSTPGRHIYSKKDKLPLIQSGFGTVLISTSSGLMTDRTARKKKVGGEILCYVW